MYMYITCYPGTSENVAPCVGNTYSGKLSREKTFANFAVLWLFMKVFPTKFGGVAPLVLQKQAIHESFVRENRIFYQFAFSPSKVSHYTVIVICM